jgi:hypothetical protein
VEGRTVPGSQAVQLYDVVQLAHHFGVSLIACLYRLRNLRFLTDTEFHDLRQLDESGQGRAIASKLGFPEPDHEEARNWFRQRVLGLALEAYRREEISHGKLVELLASVGVQRDAVDQLLEETGLAERAGGGIGDDDARSEE